MANVIKISPNPMAKAKFPFPVSSAMDVVRTRVAWSIFPPTIMMAPTSPMARPNPASMAVNRDRRPSHISATIRCRRVEFREINRSWYSAQRSRMDWWEIEAINGVMINTWAMIIAVGVNSNPNTPKGRIVTAACKQTDPPPRAASPSRRSEPRSLFVEIGTG